MRRIVSLIVGLRPAKYHLRFRPLDSLRLCMTAAPVQEAVEAFLPTYYPSGASVRDATRVEVGVSKRLSSIDIVARQGTTFTVSGRLLMSGQVPEYASLWLLAEDEEPTAWVVGSGMTDREGAFRFLNVAPGAYSLSYLVGGRPGTSVGRADVTVADQAGTAVAIDAPAPLRLRGTVTVEGLAGAKLKGTKVALIPTDRIMDPTCVGEVQDNGDLAVEGCSEGRYTVAVTPSARTHYVKQVFYAGADVSRSLVASSHSSGDLLVVLRQGAGRIRGTLLPAKSAWYVVVPRELPAQVLPAQVRLGHSDSTGRFLVEGLPPGRYAVVGFTAPDVSALHNPDALLALASLGTEARLRENDEAVIAAPVVSALEGERVLRLAGGQLVDRRPLVVP